MAVIATDPFTRTVSDSWGAEPVTGETYQLNGVTTDYDVAAGVGTIQPSTTNVDRFAVIVVDEGDDYVVQTAVRWAALPATGVLRIGVIPRWKDGSNFYWGEIVVNPAGAVTVRAQKRSGGTMSGLATFSHGTTYVAGTFWTVKAKMAGRRIQVKAWTGGTEPAWQVDYTDLSEAPETGSGVGCYARNETSTPVTTHVASFDNFTASPAISVDAQDVWPPRNLITITDLTAGDAVELYRVVGGELTLIRDGANASIPNTSFLLIDAELPFGVPVSYVAQVNGTFYNATPYITYVLPGGKVVLSDAVGGLAAEVVILAWPDKTYGRDSTSFRVGGRNVVVSGDLTGYSSTIELYVETTSARDNLLALLAAATEGIIQIRQPGGYDGVDSYVVVLVPTERRWSQDGTDQRRVISLDVEEVEPWAPSLEARGFTLQDLADLYTGLTLADLAADYTTQLQLAQADLS